MDMFVNLDIGGENFRMLRDTVRKYPECLILEALKGAEREQWVLQDNVYFFDRNPRYFEVIVDFMRSGKIYRKKGLNEEQLRDEIHYWGMSSYMDLGSKTEEKDKAKIWEYEPNITTKSQPQTQVKLLNHEEEEPNLIMNEEDEPNLVMNEDIQPTLIMNEGIQPTLIMNEDIQPTLIMNEGIQPTLIMNEDIKPTLIMNEDIQPTLIMNEDIQPTLIMNEDIQPNLVMNEDIQYELLTDQEIHPNLSRQGSNDTQPLDEFPQIQDSPISHTPSILNKSLNPGILTNDLVSSILSEPEASTRLTHPTSKPNLTKQPPISQEEVKLTSLSTKQSTHLRAPPKPSAPIPTQNPNKRERVLPWQSSTPTQSRVPKKSNTGKSLQNKKPRLAESQESLGSVDINESYESSFIDDTEQIEDFSEDLYLDESDSEAEYKPTKKSSKKPTQSSSKSTIKSRKRN